MQDKLISIIVPAYNIENYIERCLKSILFQTHRALEIIIVDDGSTDQTGNIIDAYADKDERILTIHTVNNGVASARMTGIRRATGEYIGFVDGDDFIDSDMFEHLLYNAITYQADISHCGYKMIFPSGKIDYYYSTGVLVQQGKTEALQELLSGERIEPGLWNKLFHKNLFHSLLHDELVPLDITINEDLLMNYFLFKEAERSVYEDKCFYHYILRKNSAATSHVNEHKLKDPITVSKIIYADTKSLDTGVHQVAEKRLIGQIMGVAVLSAVQHKDLIIPFRQCMRKELRKQIPNIMRKKYFSNYFRAKAVWIALWPSSYQIVHAIYGKITGLDKKYKIE